MKKVCAFAIGTVLVLFLIFLIDWNIYRNSNIAVSNAEPEIVAETDTGTQYLDNNIHDSSVADGSIGHANSPNQINHEDYGSINNNNAIDEIPQWKLDRESWIENFPYEPTYHPTVKYEGEPLYDEDLDAMIAETYPEKYKLLEELRDKIWDARTYDEENKYLEVARPIGDEFREIKRQHLEYAKIIENHGYMKQFFSTPLRHTKEFSMLYDILSSEGISSPLAIGKTYTNIVDWYESVDRDPDSVHPYIKGIPPGTTDFEQRQLTWGEVHEKRWMYMANILADPDNYPYENPPTKEHAALIRKRIVSEIPMHNMDEYMHLPPFAYHGSHERSLQIGDQLLIPANSIDILDRQHDE